MEVIILIHHIILSGVWVQTFEDSTTQLASIEEYRESALEDPFHDADWVSLFSDDHFREGLRQFNDNDNSEHISVEWLKSQPPPLFLHLSGKSLLQLQKAFPYPTPGRCGCFFWEKRMGALGL